MQIRAESRLRIETGRPGSKGRPGIIKESEVRSPLKTGSESPSSPLKSRFHPTPPSDFPKAAPTKVPNDFDMGRPFMLYCAWLLSSI